MKRKIILILIILIALTGCHSIHVDTNKDGLVTTLNKMDMLKNYQMDIKMNMSHNEQTTTVNMTYKYSMYNESDGDIEYTATTIVDGIEESFKGYISIQPDIITNYMYDSINGWSINTEAPSEYQEVFSSFSLFRNAKKTFLREERLDADCLCDVYNIKIDDLSYLDKLLGDTAYNISMYLDSIAFEMYIDNAEKLVRRIYIDLTESMNKYSLDDETKIDEYDITIDYSNFEKTKVVIPLYEIEAGNTDTNKNKFKNYPQIPYESTVMPLNFNITDAIEHPSKQILYFICSEEKSLYEVNYITNDIRKVNFDLVPERLILRNEKLYVTLLKGEHSPYWSQEDQQGAIAIVNANTMAIENVHDVAIDPYSIEIDKDGYIYITSGSGQWSNFNSYNENFELICTERVSQQSPIRYNETVNNIYCLEGLANAGDYKAFTIDNGIFSLYNNQTHLLNPVNEHFRISPDGKYIFNSSGVILNCSINLQENLTYKGKLQYDFEDVTFDLSRNTFYTSHGNQILINNYFNYDIKGYYTSYGTVKFMFYKDDNVITVGTDKNNKYYIEVINEEKAPIVVKTDKVYIEGEARIINFEVTDMTKHPNKNIYYFTSYADKALYEYDYDKNKVREIKFSLPPEQLTFMDNKVYVTLLKGAHNPYWNRKDQKGAFAIVDANTMELEKQVDINHDPFDIAVDKDGYVYITPGSGQWASLTRYNPTGEPINEVSCYQGEYIIYNPHVNKVYTVSNPNLTGIDVKGFTLDFSYSFYCSKTLNKLVGYIQVSPDGAYIYNGSGDILGSSTKAEEDLMYIDKLKHNFSSITFSENEVYTAKSKTVYVYNNSTFELVNRIISKNTIKSLFYDSGMLFAITVNDNGNCQLEQLEEGEK